LGSKRTDFQLVKTVKVRQPFLYVLTCQSSGNVPKSTDYEIARYEMPGYFIILNSTAFRRSDPCDRPALRNFFLPKFKPSSKMP
jgi:hypothetical protein